MTENSALPMEYERGFRDAGNYPGDHYTVDDDFLTIYMGKNAIENFDPEKHDWVEVYGPNQEANARLIVTACNNYEQVLEVLKYIDDYENIDINHVKATVRRAICQVEKQSQ